jgi:hypothetical protein
MLPSGSQGIKSVLLPVGNVNVKLAVNVVGQLAKAGGSVINRALANKLGIEANCPANLKRTGNGTG